MNIYSGGKIKPCSVAFHSTKHHTCHWRTFFSSAFSHTPKVTLSTHTDQVPKTLQLEAGTGLMVKAKGWTIWQKYIIMILKGILIHDIYQNITGYPKSLHNVVIDFNRKHGKHITQDTVAKIIYKFKKTGSGPTKKWMSRNNWCVAGVTGMENIP